MPADALPDNSHLITLSTISTVIIGLVVWILKSALPALIKQHRDDVFQLHAECRQERAADQERHDAAMAQRDEKDARRDQQIQQLLEFVTSQIKQAQK